MDPAVQHGVGLGRRMLGGAGALSLAPYRADSSATIPVVAHSLGDGGRLIVVCPAADASYFGDTEVRVDGVKKAPEMSADITVAGLHALGEVRWLTIGESAGFPGSPINGIAPPEATREMSTGEMSTGEMYALGVVELKKALMHGPCGVVKLPLDELRPIREEMELASRELDARDVVGRLSTEELGHLLSDVLVGFVPGFRCSEFEMGASAALHAGQADGTVWVADIDTNGLMLSTVYGNRLTSVFVDFPERIRTFTDLAGAVSALADRASARHASPRI